MTELAGALSILSTMITPAVLILASGSLSLTTSQRLSRSIDRVRFLADVLNREKYTKWVSGEELENERIFLLRELVFASRRSRFMQRAMTSLYLALCIFVATIIAIGIFELMGLQFAWVLLLLGFGGIALLFYACLQLIMESRLALKAVNLEMNHTLARFKPKKQTGKP